MSETINLKWHENLVKDCKEIIESTKVTTGELFLFGKWKLGDRILKDYNKFGHAKFGNYTQEMFAKELNTSQPQISNIIAFREHVGADFKAWALENINTANKSWRKIVQEWIRQPKKEVVKVTPEELLAKILTKFSKEQVKLLVARAEAGSRIYKNLEELIPLKELGVNIIKLENLTRLLIDYYNTKFEEKEKEIKFSETKNKVKLEGRNNDG